MTNELIKVAGNAPAEAVKNFENFSGNLFQSIVACKQSSNERKVRIAQINAELQAYLAKEESKLKLKSGGMDMVRQVYEGQLNKAELSFEERKELLDKFSGIILQLIFKEQL